jgi:hypothetical protein
MRAVPYGGLRASGIAQQSGYQCPEATLIE